MAGYLTLEDEKNFGPELLDVAIRSARHALAPELQQLHDENAQLRDEVGRATKTTIDQYLDANVPNWRQINANERFHNWLLQSDTFSGVIRDRLLKDAARSGDASRVANFFRAYLAAAGQVSAEQAPAGRAPRRAATTPSGQRIYDRSEITRMWERRRQGKIDDQSWARWEAELCRASAEGRIRGGLDQDGNPR